MEEKAGVHGFNKFVNRELLERGSSNSRIAASPLKYGWFCVPSRQPPKARENKPCRWPDPSRSLRNRRFRPDIYEKPRPATMEKQATFMVDGVDRRLAGLLSQPQRSSPFGASPFVPCLDSRFSGSPRAAVKAPSTVTVSLETIVENTKR